MAKKTTKTKRKARAKGPRGKRITSPAAPTPVRLAESVTPIIITATASAPVAKVAHARMSRRSLTPAQRRGLDLVRFLRIHTKKPYGRRGEEAIRRLAVEVGHMGNLELGAAAQS